MDGALSLTLRLLFLVVSSCRVLRSLLLRLCRASLALLVARRCARGAQNMELSLCGRLGADAASGKHTGSSFAQASVRVAGGADLLPRGGPLRARRSSLPCQHTPPRSDRPCPQRLPHNLSSLKNHLGLKFDALWNETAARRAGI